jgi:hypothetical protein
MFLKEQRTLLLLLLLLLSDWKCGTNNASYIRLNTVTVVFSTVWSYFLFVTISNHNHTLARKHSPPTTSDALWKNAVSREYILHESSSTLLTHDNMTYKSKTYTMTNIIRSTNGMHMPVHSIVTQIFQISSRKNWTQISQVDSCIFCSKYNTISGTNSEPPDAAASPISAHWKLLWLDSFCLIF